MKMDCQAAARAMNGILKGNNAGFSGVSTDSRAVCPGELFVALRGERFDGHAYIAAAAERGAVAAVVDAEGDTNFGSCLLPRICVENTRHALGALAASWRQRFSIPVIAVTGSNGKTTTKEMLQSILTAHFGDAVLATRGNLNNDIGVPLTLCRLDATHRAAIVEMGMNHPGEIAYLTRIARPNVAIVTNAQRAHLEGMGSLETIATEKGSVFMGLSKPGVAVFNADDPWSGLWRTQCAGRTAMDFAFHAPAAVTGRYCGHGLESRLTIIAGGETAEVALALPGAHNARNALGAATAALAAGVPLAAVCAGLSSFTGVHGRLQRRAGVNGATVLDDTYNANPDSVRAGIDVLAATIGKTVLVLGDMGEIGEMTGQFHDEVGGYAKSQGIDRLFAFGESSALAARNFGIGAEHFRRIEDLVARVRKEMNGETTVLVKGSRFMRMERVSDAIALDDQAATEGDASCC